MKAPFPWFGGKSRAASLIWSRFGNVPNYVEPFAGSLAVLLARPHKPKVETVNDKDCYLANFWRAVQHDADAVAAWADWPVNEIDLHARHRWLLQQTDFRERMIADPDFYDAKIAGWWVWGLCVWIGGGWGIAEVRQLPHLGDAGRGLHRGSLTDSMGYLRKLQARLRKVRVACGDWARIMGETPTTKHGLTAVVLDPPYDTHEAVYNESNAVARDVAAWAQANGDNPLLRIALCGYEGDYSLDDGWECVEWKANGGYSNRNRAANNANRERIWFSPACLKPPQQATLFDMEVAA
jgi:hypothetical protein